MKFKHIFGCVCVYVLVANMCTAASLTDGTVSPSVDSAVGVILEPACNTDFHLSSTATVTCTTTAAGDTAEWTPAVPTCGKIIYLSMRTWKVEADKNNSCLITLTLLTQRRNVLPEAGTIHVCNITSSIKCNGLSVVIILDYRLCHKGFMYEDSLC